MTLSDQYENAKAELIKSAEIKKTYLGPTSRELASIDFSIGKLLMMASDYEEAKKYFEQALDILQQCIKDETNDEEIADLKSVCKELQDHIKDAKESAKSHEQILRETKEALTGALPSKSNDPINDITALVRKRQLDRDPTDEAKKPKPE
jgi:tetratricopeptide (TPR) repeat protein